MDITEQTLLDELAANEPQPLDPKTEVCVVMLMERTGGAQATVLRRLKQLEHDGVLVSREAIHDGRRVRAYRKADK